MGEFLYFFIYVLQQLGVMLGVGAQTVLLCTHLVAVHRGESENPRASYAHAARIALGTSLLLMIVSGLGAVALHLINGQSDVVLAPTFLFKWMLIAALTVGFFGESRFPNNTVFYAFTGGTWYALFLVHSLGPIATWGTLAALYATWMVLYGAVWAAFAGLMHWRRMPAQKSVPVVAVKKEIPKPKEKEVVKVVPPPPAPQAIHVAPPPPPKPVFVPPPVVVPPPLVVAKPTPAVVAPQPKPTLPKVEQPVVITVDPPKASWWEWLLSFLPKSKPHAALPAMPLPPPPAHPAPLPPKAIPPAPALVIEKPLPPPPSKPVVAPIAPLPAVVLQPLSLQIAHSTPPVPPAPHAEAKHSFIEEVMDYLHVPALRVMPKTAAEVGKQNRPPVVKLGESNS